MVTSCRAFVEVRCCFGGHRIIRGSIPESKHFFNRQGKQSFLVSFVITHLFRYRH